MRAGALFAPADRARAGPRTLAIGIRTRAAAGMGGSQVETFDPHHAGMGGSQVAPRADPGAPAEATSTPPARRTIDPHFYEHGKRVGQSRRVGPETIYYRNGMLVGTEWDR
jgi:hypothetical protein